MRASQLAEGDVCALVEFRWTTQALGQRGDEPTRATVLGRASGGLIRVRVEHPDPWVPDEEREVFTRDIRGHWDQPWVKSDESWGTWAELAAAQYARVRRQRQLADRLTALGIPRGRWHYAGRGGWPGDVRDGPPTSLDLGAEELDRLLTLAEAGAS